MVRICPGKVGASCGKFRSSEICDPHTLCKGCRGKDCNRDDKCIECEIWTEEQWTKYESRGKYRPRKNISSNSQVLDSSDVSDSSMPAPAQMTL